jgi:hypothetical protein
MPTSPPIADVLTPRPEVLEGTLTDAIFAASLGDVVLDSGPDVYRDPADFFSATHPSDGLRVLLNDAFGRVGGGRPDCAVDGALERVVSVCLNDSPPGLPIGSTAPRGASRS